MSPCAECPFTLKPEPTTDERDAAYFARRRREIVALHAGEIIAQRSWPIGHKLGFPTLAARAAWEKGRRDFILSEYGQAVLEEVRTEVNKRGK